MHDRPRSGRALGALSLTALFAILLSMANGAARAETALERGTYLVRGIVACGNCHTPKDADSRALPNKEFAGGLRIEFQGIRAVVPNITPDKETGIGKWTDDEIASAIRDGRRPDGTLIGPPMPFALYRGISDKDVRAIVAYLRALPPVANKLGKSSFDFPLPPAYGPKVEHVAEVERGNKLAYGAYLAGPLGHCIECHTPLLKGGRLEMSRLGGGGRELPTFEGATIVSANITPDKAHGIGRWSDHDIKTAITKGVRPDGRKLVNLMAFDWYAKIRADDLTALVAYLRSLKPLE